MILRVRLTSITNANKLHPPPPYGFQMKEIPFAITLMPNGHLLGLSDTL